MANHQNSMVSFQGNLWGAFSFLSRFRLLVWLTLYCGMSQNGQTHFKPLELTHWVADNTNFIEHHLCIVYSFAPTVLLKRTPVFKAGFFQYTTVWVLLYLPRLLVPDCRKIMVNAGHIYIFYSQSCLDNILSLKTCYWVYPKIFITGKVSEKIKITSVLLKYCILS